MTATTTFTTNLAFGLSHPARVVHPVLSGQRFEIFEVTIETVDEREERSGRTVFRDLTFRGPCRIGDWQGKKTFYASRCRNVVDLSPGGHKGNMHTPEAILAWLKSLCTKPQA